MDVKREKITWYKAVLVPSGVDRIPIAQPQGNVAQQTQEEANEQFLASLPSGSKLPMGALFNVLPPKPDPKHPEAHLAFAPKPMSEKEIRRSTLPGYQPCDRIPISVGFATHDQQRASYIPSPHIPHE
jgi:hypothetical protein